MRWNRGHNRTDLDGRGGGQCLRSRPRPSTGGGGRGAPGLDEAGKQALRDAWDQFMRRHLRG